jgi:hypothetical protein
MTAPNTEQTDTKPVVYVYHETNDNAAFGEMITQVYAHMDDAKSFLKMRVEKFFGVPWEECRKLVLESDDTDTEMNSFEEDYVSYGPTGDGCCFWSIDEMGVR